MINHHFINLSSQPFSVKTALAGMTLTLLAGLTGCQKPADNAAPETSTQANIDPSKALSANGTIDLQLPTVYATTNVWGSVAKAVGGDKVNVVIGVNDLSQDPHDYQATATDKLNVTKASLVLVNGGGYDDWGTSLAESVSNKPVVIDAVALSGLQPPHTDEHTDHEHENDSQHSQHQGHADNAGHHHAHGEFNEHVFFSLDTAKKVAEAVNNHLATTAPANKAIYAQNTQQFIQQIDRLKAKAQQVAQQNGQKQRTAFATEPVIGYMLADMGIKDVTPSAYVEQSETDAGVSVKVLNDSKNLLTNQQVGLLIVNAQTEDATSKQLVTLAKAARVPVVEVYETFPSGVTSYTQFIEKTIDDFAAALR